MTTTSNPTSNRDIGGSLPGANNPPSLNENPLWVITTDLVNLYQDILADKTKGWMPDPLTRSVANTVLSVPGVGADFVSNLVDSYNDKSKHPVAAASVKSLLSYAAGLIVSPQAQLGIDGANFLGQATRGTADAFAGAASSIGPNDGFIRALVNRDLKDQEFESRLTAMALQAPKQLEDLLFHASFCLIRGTAKVVQDFAHSAINSAKQGVKNAAAAFSKSNQKVVAEDIKMEGFLRNYWHDGVQELRQRLTTSTTTTTAAVATTSAAVSDAAVTVAEVKALYARAQPVQKEQNRANSGNNGRNSSKADHDFQAIGQLFQQPTILQSTQIEPNAANNLGNVSDSNASGAVSHVAQRLKPISLRPNIDMTGDFSMPVLPPLPTTNSNISITPIVAGGVFGFAGTIAIGNFTLGATATTGGSSIMAGFSVPLGTLSTALPPLLIVTGIVAIGLKLLSNQKNKFRKVVDLNDEQRRTALSKIEEMCGTTLFEDDKRSVMELVNQQYKLEQEIDNDNRRINRHTFSHQHDENLKEGHTSELDTCTKQLSAKLSTIVFKTRTERMLQEGTALINGVNPEKAVDKFTELVEFTGGAATARYYRALSYLKAGSTDKAIEDLETASQSTECKFQALSVAATVLLEKKDFQHAEDYLQKAEAEAVNAKSDEQTKQVEALKIKYYTDVGDNYLQEQKYDEANSCYAKALQIKSDDQTAGKIRERKTMCCFGSLQQGCASFADKDYTAAKQHYNASLNDPAMTQEMKFNAFLNLGKIAAREGDNEKAISYFQLCKDRTGEVDAVAARFIKYLDQEKPYTQQQVYVTMSPFLTCDALSGADRFMGAKDRDASLPRLPNLLPRPMDIDKPTAMQKVEDICFETANINSIRRNNQMNNDKSLAFMSDNLWSFLEKFRASEAFTKCERMRKLVDGEISEARGLVQREGDQALNSLIFDMHLVRNMVVGIKNSVKGDDQIRENLREFMGVFREFSQKTLASYEQHLTAVADTAHAPVSNGANVGDNSDDVDVDQPKKIAPGITAIYANAAQEVQKLQSDLSALTLDPNSIDAQVGILVEKMEAVSLQQIGERISKQIAARVALVKETRELADYHLSESRRLLPQYDYQLKKEAIENEITKLNEDVAEKVARLNSTDQKDIDRVINAEKRVGELQEELRRMDEEKAMKRWEWHTGNLVNASAFFGLTVSILQRFEPMRKFVPILAGAQKIAQAGAAVSTIGYNIMHFGAAAAASGPFAPLVAIAGAAKTIVELIWGAEPSDRDVILGAINQVSEQINRVEEIVRGGFNATFQLIAKVDERTQQGFNALEQRIIGGFKAVFGALQEISNDVNQANKKLDESKQQIDKLTATLQQDMHNLGVKITEVYNLRYSERRKEAYLACRSGEALPDNEIRPIFVSFHDRACVQAKSVNLSGAVENRTDNVEASAVALLDKLKEDAFSTNQINALRGYINSEYKANATEVLVNPDVWAEAVTDLVDFIAHTPKFKFASYSASLLEIYNAGKDFQNFIAGLKCSPDFFVRLMREYLDSLSSPFGLSTAIGGVILELGGFNSYEVLKQRMINKMPWHTLFSSYDALTATQTQTVKQLREEQANYSALGTASYSAAHAALKLYSDATAECVQAVEGIKTWGFFFSEEEVLSRQRQRWQAINKISALNTIRADHMKHFGDGWSHRLDELEKSGRAQSIENTMQQISQIFSRFAGQKTNELAQKSWLQIYRDYLEELDPAAYKNLLLTIKARLAQNNTSLHATLISPELRYRVLSAFMLFAFAGNQEIQAQFQKIWSPNKGMEKILDDALAVLGTGNQITKAKKDESLKIFDELLSYDGLYREIAKFLRMIAKETSDARRAKDRGEKIPTYFPLNNALRELERIFVLHDFNLGVRSSGVWMSSASLAAQPTSKPRTKRKREDKDNGVSVCYDRHAHFYRQGSQSPTSVTSLFTTYGLFGAPASGSGSSNNNNNTSQPTQTSASSQSSTSSSSSSR